MTLLPPGMTGFLKENDLLWKLGEFLTILDASFDSVSHLCSLKGHQPLISGSQTRSLLNWLLLASRMTMRRRSRRKRNLKRRTMRMRTVTMRRKRLKKKRKKKRTTMAAAELGDKKVKTKSSLKVRIQARKQLKKTTQKLNSTGWSRFTRRTRQRFSGGATPLSSSTPTSPAPSSSKPI